MSSLGASMTPSYANTRPTYGILLTANSRQSKVDREERPDVDQCFMTFVQATSGGGGWPMSVWLTPDLKPFVGATYFPEQRFIRVLNTLAEKWSTERYWQVLRRFLT